MLPVLFFYWFFYFMAPSGPKQPVKGCVFVTGCDSGMGKVSAERLAKIGYHVFMGCFLPASIKEIADSKDVYEKVVSAFGSVFFLLPGVLKCGRDAQSNKTAVQIDVTSDESVKNAVAQVEKALADKKLHPVGLIAVINCAGVAFEGSACCAPCVPARSFVFARCALVDACWRARSPCEYFPMQLFQRQIDVNLMGYVRTAQVSVVSCYSIFCSVFRVSRLDQ